VYVHLSQTPQTEHNTNTLLLGQLAALALRAALEVVIAALEANPVPRKQILVLEWEDCFNVFSTTFMAVEALATPREANVATYSALPVTRSDIRTFKLHDGIKPTATFFVWRGGAVVTRVPARKVCHAATDAPPISGAHGFVVLTLWNSTPLNRWGTQVRWSLPVASHHGGRKTRLLDFSYFFRAAITNP
jgi:hypothetical protein